MSAPAELTHVTETVEIFKVDVSHIPAAELLTQGRHSSPRAAGSMISDKIEIFTFASFLAPTGAQGVTILVRTSVRLVQVCLELSIFIFCSDLSQVSLKSLSLPHGIARA